MALPVKPSFLRKSFLTLLSLFTFSFPFGITEMNLLSRRLRYLLPETKLLRRLSSSVASTQSAGVAGRFTANLRAYALRRVDRRRRRVSLGSPMVFSILQCSVL